MNPEGTLRQARVELSEMINRWAQEKKILNPGDALEVTVNISKVEPVMVKLTAHEGYQGSNDVDGMSIDNLELTTRTVYCLINANITTVGLLRRMTARNMLGIPRFGKISLRQVQEALDFFAKVKVKWIDANGHLIRKK